MPTPKLKRVLVFNPKHEVIGQIEQDVANPAGMAVDNENRLLYVADVELDQVLVYDADTLKPIRKIGTTGKNHELTTPGDFAKPVGVAVDSDGNLYVADTLNNRVEIFDADGQFISTFGKAETVRVSSRAPRALPSMRTTTFGSPTECRTASRSSTRKANC